MSRQLAAGAPRAALVAIALVALAAACGDDEQVAPVGGGGGGTTSASTSTASVSSGSSSSSQSSSTGGGPVLRTVFERNPFGSQVDNLLADGDFELSFGFAGQQGWTVYSQVGQESLVAETGGLCRSGLRCARVPAGSVLFARGTSAASEWDMKATIWVKPVDSPSCVGISAQAIGCDSFFPRATLIGTGGVDDEGWCSLSTVVEGSMTATCLYVDNGSDQAMIFDEASLVALPPDPALDPAMRPSPSPVSVSPEARARMERVRDHVRDTLPLGPPSILPPGAKPLPGRTYAEPSDLGP